MPELLPKPYKQSDRRWADMELGRSGLKMRDWGCLVTAVAYMLTRFLGRPVTPAELCSWLNLRDGFTRDGLFKWTKVDEFTHGRLRHTRNPLVKRFTMQQVQLGKVLHWLARCPGNDVYMDPASGTFVSLAKYPNRFRKEFYRT